MFLDPLGAAMASCSEASGRDSVKVSCSEQALCRVSGPPWFFPSPDSTEVKSLFCSHLGTSAFHLQANLAGLVTSSAVEWQHTSTNYKEGQAAWVLQGGCLWVARGRNEGLWQPWTLCPSCSLQMALGKELLAVLWKLHTLIPCFSKTVLDMLRSY